MSSKRIGIIDLEFQLPRFVIKQEEISAGLNIDLDKLKIGLGLQEFSVPDLNEDCVSLALSAVERLCKKQNINKVDVGKIEVGSESNFDTSKSIKSYLMQLFSNNNEISGCDNVHACYGGTNALLNSIAYLESSLCDKKYAIVVCTDICFYKEKEAIPTSGGGAVAILLGEDPVLEIVNNSIIHFSMNTCEFLRPVKAYPYPVYNGKESIDVFIKAFDTLIGKFKGDFDKIVCHSPYPKLIEKLCKKHSISPSKYIDGLVASRRNGNSYTASLYFGLISILGTVKENDKILMFSFGSGCVSTMFCLQRTDKIVNLFNLIDRLDHRENITFNDYIKICNNYNLPSITGLKCEKESDSFRYTISKIEEYYRHYSN